MAATNVALVPIAASMHVLLYLYLILINTDYFVFVIPLAGKLIVHKPTSITPKCHRLILKRREDVPINHFLI